MESSTEPKYPLQKAWSVLRQERFRVFLSKLINWISIKLIKKTGKETKNLINEAQKIAFGGERVTHLHPNDLYYAHLSIYRFASQFIKDKIVLDAGCGDGYGTHYLAEHGGKSIVGIDISKVAPAVRGTQQHPHL